MQNSALLGSMNALHTRFPDEPQEEYSRQAKLVLKRLNLEDMVRAIDEMQSMENGGKADNDAENNFHSSSVNLPKSQDKEPSDEEDDSIANDNDISNDFSGFASPEQLTGVFPISSSGFGTDVFIEENALEKSPSPLCETASQSKGRRDIANSIEKRSLRNPPTLRTVMRNKENVNSAKTDNSSASSVDKSKSIMQLFSKKPVPGLSPTVTQIDRKAPQSEGSGIFVTDDLGDEDLEMDWPSDVLSSFQNERTVNLSRSVLRGNSENSLPSNLIRFNSKKT